MTTRTVNVIGREELLSRRAREQKKTFHLWNVLSREHFKPERMIPGSTWIPIGDIEAKVKELGVRKDDEIVTYCGGFKCPASKQAAEKLVSLGFTNVSAYEGGLEDWESSGQPFARYKEDAAYDHAR
jgi:rhodanese-related sulfurtransferase